MFSLQVHLFFISLTQITDCHNPLTYILQICHSLKSKQMPCLRYRKRKGRITRHKVPDEDQTTELNMNIMVTDQSLPMSLEDIATIEKRERHQAGMRRSKNTAIRIDQISRILFPLTFAGYTFGYWLTYS